MGGSLIEIRNATVYRGSTRVFDGLDLDIDRDEQVAIVGPNGAGKSTLLKLISRELYPVHTDRATVRILGRDSWNVWELRQHLGIVSDDLQDRFDRSCTGLDVVLSGFFSSVGTHGSLATRVTDQHRERACAALAAFGAADHCDTPLARMSTGQRRRCLLARAMIHEPHSLVLDEPAAGLDLAATFECLARLRQLVEEGRSLVLVTHTLQEIIPQIGRVILLAGGRIVADGDKRDVLTQANLEACYESLLSVHELHGYYLCTPR